MSRILVHVHVYYLNLWSELKQVLQNITEPYDLIVTMTQDKTSDEKDVSELTPQARILRVENKGFDVWPFLKVLKSVDLSRYQYVIKLHTKRDLPTGTIRNGFDVSGNKWRRYLYAFLQSRETFEKSLQAFERDRRLGMIADYRLIVRNDRSNPEAVRKARELLTALGYSTKTFSYVMGTMFMARAEVFSKLQDINITADQFETSEHGSDDVLPYAFERLFGFLIEAQKFRLKDVLVLPAEQIVAQYLSRIKNFLWRKKETSSGKIIIKFFKIPVFVTKSKGGKHVF